MPVSQREDEAAAALLDAPRLGQRRLHDALGVDRREALEDLRDGRWPSRSRSGPPGSQSDGGGADDDGVDPGRTIGRRDGLRRRADDPPTVAGWYQVTAETTMATTRTSARATSA